MNGCVENPFSVKIVGYYGTAIKCADMPAWIRLQDVSKHYPTPAGIVPVLKNINLGIERGEFVAIIGKSGSGKSTLLNMLTGIDHPSRGEIWIGETAVHRLSESRLALWRGRGVGIVFQFFQLLPTLSLLDNVMLPMDFAGQYSVRERKTRALALLDLVGMSTHAGKLPSAVSGGQQQRVAIARALANDPPLLVADEPTGNLDSATADSIFRLFETFVAQGKTIVMVTHDNDIARRATRRSLSLTAKSSTRTLRAPSRRSTSTSSPSPPPIWSM